MSTNPYRVTDKTHDNILAAANAVAVAIQNRDAIIKIGADAIGVPDGYRYDVNEKAFVAPDKKE
jgi:hypothetical protein